MKKKIALFLCALMVLGTGFILPGNVLQMQSAAAESDGHINESEPPDDTDGSGDGEPSNPDEPGEEAPGAEGGEDGNQSGEGGDGDGDGELQQPEEPEEPSEPEDKDEETKADDEEEAEEEADQDEPEEEEEPLDNIRLRTGAAVPSGALVIHGVVITIDSTNENASGAEDVDPYERITISFTFEIQDTEKIPVGSSVVIRLPDEILVDTGGNQPYVVEIPLEGTGDVIALVTLTEGSQDMVLTFTDELHKNESIDFAYFSIACRFNGDMLEDGGERTILFEYDGSTFPIVVKFKGKQVDLAKEVADQGTDKATGALTQTWKITANSEQAAVSDLVIEEQLPKGLEYVGYRFEGVAMNDPGSWSVDESRSADGTVLFSYDGALSDAVVIYLYTQITDMQHFSADPSAEGHVLVENTVTLSGKDVAELTTTALASVSAGQLTKSGEFIGADGSIEWTLVLNDGGQTMTDVTLYDNMPDGLVLEEGSIVITTGSGTLEVGKDVLLSSSPASGGTLWTFRFVDALAEQCTVKYTTTVENLKTIQDFTFTNQAYLVWGSGNTSANCDVPVSGSNGIFNKYARGYNGHTQELGWSFQINVNKYGFTGKAVVTDNFTPGRNSNKGLTQGEPTITAIRSTDRNGKVENLEHGTDYTFKENDVQGTFTLIIENEWVDERYVLVEFTTKILDHDVVAGNDSKTYWNEATMELEGVEYDAENSFNATPKVLEKTYTYDYATRIITWKLAVNPFALGGLGSVTVTDNLPEGLTLLAVYKDTVDDSGLLRPGQYAYNESERTVQFDFANGELDGVAVDLYLETKVDDSFYQGNFYQKVIKNEATIEMPELNKSYTVSKPISLSNTLVGKEGGFDEEMGVIAWEILVNSSAVDWEMADVVLSDPLPQGLLLDIESVRLYRYGLDEKGNEITTEAVPLDRNKCVSYDTSTNLFEFTFPADAPAGYRYRLFFETEVLEAGNFENEITLTGFSNDSESSKKVINVSDGEDLSGAIASRKASITLEKTDGSGAPLEGAVFQLRNKDGDVLETATTDKDGKIAFVTLLKHLTDYALYEVEAPEGYVLLTDPIPVYIEKDKDGRAVASTLTYYAENVLKKEAPDPDPDPTPSKPDPGKPGGGGKDRDRDRNKYRPGLPGAPKEEDAPGQEPGQGGQQEKPGGQETDGNHYNPSTGR